MTAWLLADPSHRSFDAQVRPDLRGSALEREVLKRAEDCTIDLMRQYGVSGDCICADAFRDDTARVQLLKSLGWEPDHELPYVLNHTEINSIAVPVLPDGYIFRLVRGIEDAAALSAVHNAAFGPIWTPDLYQKIMEFPVTRPNASLLSRLQMALWWPSPLSGTTISTIPDCLNRWVRTRITDAVVLDGRSFYTGCSKWRLQG